MKKKLLFIFIFGNLDLFLVTPLDNMAFICTRYQIRNAAASMQVSLHCTVFKFMSGMCFFQDSVKLAFYINCFLF